METITANYLATNNSLLKHIPWTRSRTAMKQWKQLWRIMAHQTQWYTMAHKNRSYQAKKFNPNLENTASMGIHQKGNVKTKNHHKALFENCARNGIERCLENTPKTTMELRIPIPCQDHAIDSQPCWETIRTNFTWVNNRINTKHLRVPRFWMVW